MLKKVFELLIKSRFYDSCRSLVFFILLHIDNIYAIFAAKTNRLPTKNQSFMIL